MAVQWTLAETLIRVRSVREVGRPLVNYEEVGGMTEGWVGLGVVDVCEM